MNRECIKINEALPHNGQDVVAVVEIQSKVDNDVYYREYQCRYVGNEFYIIDRKDYATKLLEYVKSVQHPDDSIQIYGWIKKINQSNITN